MLLLKASISVPSPLASGSTSSTSFAFASSGLRSVQRSSQPDFKVWALAASAQFRLAASLHWPFWIASASVNDLAWLRAFRAPWSLAGSPIARAFVIARIASPELEAAQTADWSTCRTNLTASCDTAGSEPDDARVLSTRAPGRSARTRMRSLGSRAYLKPFTPDRLKYDLPLTVLGLSRSILRAFFTFSRV